MVRSVKLRDSTLAYSEYAEYTGSPGKDPRSVSTSDVSEGIVRIIETEGPVVAKRVYDLYLRGCGIRRMGHELKSIMNKALAHAIRQGRVVSENEAAERGLLFSVVRVKGSPPIRLRRRGPRSFEEIPPSEVSLLARYLTERQGLAFGSEEHFRAILEWLDLKRLTPQVGSTLREILNRSFVYVDESLMLSLDPNVQSIPQGPGREMTDPALLVQLVGTYDLAGFDFEVALREDDVLQFVFLGRQNELLPVRGTTFKVKDLTGLTFEFLRGADGKVDRLVRHAETDIVAPRKR